MYAYKPDYVIHPGQYLEEVLESREIDKNEFSKRLGISVKDLNQIIHKKAMITAGLAVQLEKTLEISANIWNNLNTNYYSFNASLSKEKELKPKRKLSFAISNFHFIKRRSKLTQ